MMLVAFWRKWKLLQNSSAKENERNLCQDLLIAETPTRTWKCRGCTMQMCSRLSFQILLQTRQTTETIRNYQKQALVMIKRCLRKSQINSIHQNREFSCYINSEQTQKQFRKLTTNASRSYYLYSAKLKSLFRPWKKKEYLFH